MNITLDLRTSLSQRLTPQQIQYLKLLQLPLVQFEQYITEELEQNPMLEDPNSPVDDIFSDDDDDFIPSLTSTQEVQPVVSETDVVDDVTDSVFTESPIDDFIVSEDEKDPFEIYDMVWQDDVGSEPHSSDNFDDEERTPFQIKDNVTFEEDLISQLNLLDLTEEELMIGERIIGDLDSDGYFRRELQDVIDELNSEIARMNTLAQGKHYIEMHQQNGKQHSNPAKYYELTPESRRLLESALNLTNEDGQQTNIQNFPKADEIKIYKSIDIETGERVLTIIQGLEPPGVASRNIQECLVAQTKHKESSPERDLALNVLTKCYEPFIRKHYKQIIKDLNISEDELRNAIEFIKRLNPKPGGGDNQPEMNSVIPDFMINRDEESDELMIGLNDSRIPQIKLNNLYDKLKKTAKLKKFNKDTKKWLKDKHEDAKFLMQAIIQRKNTMLKVMTAIAHKQKAFFYEGSSAMKPLRYKDVAEESGMDISTVCRIVNGKYVQTEYGTYELKHFFSEALPTEDGEDVSNKVIKDELKDIIDAENKSKPYSDEELSKLLGDKGYQVARRTVAKYREQMRIPVARLRVEI
ncbi:MAG: RNA polymerase factor sigma-54 [Desulfobulbaceae bacterium]|nr:RNA polymerase factor sigma-54 [Candidatus Kapabacteria bacterium]MBS4000082.1 RNA polymerase factor sigma-54 [Desulfobulbaceae bacterium]